MGTKGHRIAALCFVLPLAAGCASQQTIDEYEAEILQLREQRTQLGKENRELRNQVQGYELALNEANARIVEASYVPDGADLGADHSDLTDLGLGVEERGGNLVITLPSAITFASGRADLTAQGKEALQAVALTLDSDYPGGMFWIEGHTDNDPIKKSKFKTNRELSLARATAVLHYLVQECGIDDANCVVAGHGEYRPVADNSTPAGKARNRRVEVVVHAG